MFAHSWDVALSLPALALWGNLKTASLNTAAGPLFISTRFNITSTHQVSVSFEGRFSFWYKVSICSPSVLALLICLINIYPQNTLLTPVTISHSVFARMKIAVILTFLSAIVVVSMAAPSDVDSVKIVTTETKPKDAAPVIKSENTEKNEIIENENCTGKHRPHSTDATKFETYFTGMWIEQPCPGLNLVWDQLLCRCDYPPKHLPGEPCKDRRSVNPGKGLYKQLLNGKWYARDCNNGKSGMTWNQTECDCIANVTNQKMGGSPCDVMLNVTFNNEVVVDHAKGAWIQRPWDSRIVIRKVSGAIGNWAAHIRDSAMRVFYFAGNAWSDMMQVFISFRADKDERKEDKFQMLLSNGCNYTWIGYFEPSVALSYRAKDGTLKLQFQTYEPKTLSCNIISDFHGWHSVALLYQDGMLQVVVDGYLCLASRDFSGPVKVNQCPLTIAGDPLEKAANFRGFLDELLITRYCKV